MLACWLASGIVFGFAALKPVLVAEGVYHDLCTEEELEEGLALCAKQDMKYVRRSQVMEMILIRVGSTSSLPSHPSPPTSLHCR